MCVFDVHFCEEGKSIHVVRWNSNVNEFITIEEKNSCVAIISVAIHLHIHSECSFKFRDIITLNYFTNGVMFILL